MMDTVTTSSLLKAGNGLPAGVQGAADSRFARVIRYRDDKLAQDADTIDAVRAIAAGAPEAR